MTIPTDPPSSSQPLVRSMAGMLSWWAEAGVNYVFRDTAEGWLSAQEEPGSAGSAPLIQNATPPANTTPVRRGAATLPEASPPLGGDRTGWPTDLPGFRHWWLTEESLGEPGAFPRIAPTGEPSAAIMLLVPAPEEVDRESLLSGPNGATARLLLRAMGIPLGSAYLASALPRHTPLADYDGLAARGLADIVRHHIALAGPKRVLALGRPLASMFGKDEAIFCAPGLDELQRSGQRRQRFWQRWLEWTEGS